MKVLSLVRGLWTLAGAVMPVLEVLRAAVPRLDDRLDRLEAQLGLSGKLGELRQLRDEIRAAIGDPDTQPRLRELLQRADRLLSAVTGA